VTSHIDLHTERMFLVNICLVHGPSETQVLMPDKSELTIEDKCPNVTCENLGCGNDKFKERNNAIVVLCIIRNRAEHVKRAHIQCLYFISVGKVVHRHLSKCDSLDNF